MPHPSPLPRISAPARQWPVLAGLTVAVSLGHWALLQAAPLAVVLPAEPSMAAPHPFTTRILTPEAPVGRDGTVQAAPRAAPKAPPVSKPKSPPALADTAQAATNSVAPFTTTEEPPLELAALVTPEPRREAAPSGMVTSSHESATTPARLTVPASVLLKYDIKGEIRHIPVSAQGELAWVQDGKTYDARMEIKIFLLGSRIQTSKGGLTPQGLEPARFGDKVRSEVAAHFERTKNKISYSANTPDEVLLPGAQDQLSVFMQLASLLGGDQDRYPQGSSLSFQAVGPRSSETWVFKIGAAEILALPGGKVKAIKLSKDPVSEHDSGAEVWLAPELNYLPVRIRLTQSNGDFVDQLWRSSENPKPSP